jgi:nicotinate-nucleotide adenylyltransferase
MKIGLFFGSFNPVHVGHLIIAEYMASRTDLKKVWMVVSPHNPLKPKNSLANDYARLDLIKCAVLHNPLLNASDIEFSLPKPSYTIDTLAYLTERHPNDEFVLIMGGDNLATISKWKNYELLLKNHQIYVYHRPGYDLGEFALHPNVKVFEDAPMMTISATYIRERIRNGESVKYLIPEASLEELEKRGMYKGD